MNKIKHPLYKLSGAVKKAYNEIAKTFASFIYMLSRVFFFVTKFAILEEQYNSWLC